MSAMRNCLALYVYPLEFPDPYTVCSIQKIFIRKDYVRTYYGTGA
jgi:hypothetical protein